MTLFEPDDHALRPAIDVALRSVYDPEIPINIHDLGLIYTVRVDADDVVFVRMSLTSPACPVAGELPVWVEDALRSAPGVSGAAVEVTFDPPWGLERMSEEARLELGLDLDP